MCRRRDENGAHGDIPENCGKCLIMPLTIRPQDRALRPQVNRGFTPDRVGYVDGVLTFGHAQAGSILPVHSTVESAGDRSANPTSASLIAADRIV